MTTQENQKSKSGNNIQEDEKLPAPDGGYGWVVLISAFLVSFILDGVMYSFGLILDEIKLDFKREVSESTCNLLTSLNTGFLFCSGPIVSGLCNQFGCRTVVMGGSIVTAIMYILTAYAPNIWIMMVTYGVIGGLSTGCTYIASLIIIADYFDKKRGVATGITMAGSGVGSFVFAPLIRFIISSNDWKFTMSICASIIFQACICGALLRPLNPPINSTAALSRNKKIELRNLGNQQHTSNSQIMNNTANNMSKHSTNDGAGSSAGCRSVQGFSGSVCSLNNKTSGSSVFIRIVVGILKEMTDFRLLCQNMQFLLITLSNFIIFTGYFTPFIYLVKIVTNSNIEKDSATFLLSIIGIVNIPSRMLYGFIADRRFISAINLNTFSVFLATGSFFLFPILLSSYMTLVLFATVFAIGIAGMNSLTTMYLCDLVGLAKFSNATGIINLFRGFGCFLGPFLAGIVAEKTGSEINSFYFSGICFLVGLVLSVMVSFSQLFCSKNGNDSQMPIKIVNDESDVNRNLLK